MTKHPVFQCVTRYRVAVIVVCVGIGHARGFSGPVLALVLASMHSSYRVCVVFFFFSLLNNLVVRHNSTGFFAYFFFWSASHHLNNNFKKSPKYKLLPYLLRLTSKRCDTSPSASDVSSHSHSCLNNLRLPGAALFLIRQFLFAPGGWLTIGQESASFYTQLSPFSKC